MFSAWASTVTAPTWRAASIASWARCRGRMSIQCEHQDPGVAGQSACPFGAWRALGHQFDGPLAVGQRVSFSTRCPRVPAETLGQHRGPQRLIPLVDQRNRVLRERQRTGERAGAVSGLGGAAQQLDLVHTGQPLGTFDDRPQLERVLVGGQGFGVGVHGFGSGGRLHPRAECFGAVAGPVPMPRPLDSSENSAGGGQVGIFADRLGEGGVEADPLARQGVLVHGLRGQRVAEDVTAAPGVGFENVAVEQLSQGGVELLGLERADAAQ